MSNLLFMMRVSVFIILILCLASCNINQDRFKVSSSSMNPNFEEGDVIKINKTDRTFHYGDLIVCYQPGFNGQSEILSLTRIVGLPNDSIRVIYDICEINGSKNKIELIEESKLIIGDLIFDEYKETFPNNKGVQILHCRQQEFETDITSIVEVPNDCYFIMGDNRSNSYDSRMFGSIRANQILGKVIESDSVDK